MRNLCCFILLLFCAVRGCAQSDFYLSVGAGQGTSGAENDLIQLVKQWAAAGVKGDIGFFERIATADYVIVDCDGSVRNKQQELATFRQEVQTSQTVGNLKVRVYDGSAVVVGAFTIAGIFAGQPNNQSGTFTDVWIRRNRTWQLVSTQNACKDAEGVPAGNPPDSFFIAKEKEDWEALKRKDKAAATRLLADDFVGMYDFGFFTKSEWIKQIDEQYTVDDYTIENARLLRPSANTALLLYTSTCKATGTWAEFCSHTSRISDLFVERDGQWVALFSQDTQAASSQTLPDADLSTQVLAKEHEILDAQNRNDWTAFANLLADDLVAINEDGIRGKKEVLEEVRAAEVRFSGYKMENVKIIPQGNGAIVAYKETLVGTEHGKPFTWHIYTHSHWEKRDGKWLMTMFQDSTAKE